MNYKYCVIVLVLLLTMLILMGCEPSSEAAESGIEPDDLKLVNSYLTDLGSPEMSVDDATAMKHSLLENSHTKEIKTDWQLLVNYIRNAQSDEPVTLDYGIEFGGGQLSYDLGDVWEHIGG